MTNHFTFPFKHFNTGIINGEGIVMTSHDPSDILDVSKKEAVAIRMGQIRKMDQMVNIRMAFHEQLSGEDDFYMDKNHAIAKAIAAVRNKKWFETNDDLTIPHVSRSTEKEDTPFLWHLSRMVFDNTGQLYRSLKDQSVEVPTELDSDRYIPRKVISVVTNTYESRGVELTIEMVPQWVVLKWKGKEWHGDLKELDHHLQIPMTEAIKNIDQIFPDGVSDQIKFMHTIYLKNMCEKFTDVIMDVVY